MIRCFSLSRRRLVFLFFFLLNHKSIHTLSICSQYEISRESHVFRALDFFESYFFPFSLVHTRPTQQAHQRIRLELEKVADCRLILRDYRVLIWVREMLINRLLFVWSQTLCHLICEVKSCNRWRDENIKKTEMLPHFSVKLWLDRTRINSICMTVFVPFGVELGLTVCLTLNCVTPTHWERIYHKKWKDQLWNLKLNFSLCVGIAKNSWTFFSAAYLVRM